MLFRSYRIWILLLFFCKHCSISIVLKSHALGIENYSLRFLEQALEIPVYFENDANAAMLAEKKQKYPNAIYLSLNHTLGGAFCIDGKLFRGQNQKAGEFGHMILVPGGRKCYCGKAGCADAYCAASVLTQYNRQSLDAFMEKRSHPFKIYGRIILLCRSGTKGQNFS